MTETDDAATIIRKRWPHQPVAALVLGTGLGRLAQHIRTEAIIPFRQLPGFSVATAPGHRGRVVCGHLRDRPLIMLDGRCHLYEGYTFEQVTRSIRTMRACGAQLLIVSNASGGLNPHYSSGDIMVIEDHISLLGHDSGGSSPAAVFGRPVRELPSPYDAQLIQQALSIARQHRFVAHQGIYVTVTGPNYETRAEYRFLRRIGGDAVGMSTVPETIVASQLGMRVLGLSVITNVARPDAAQVVHESDVIDAAVHAEPYLRQLVGDLVASEAK